MEFKTMYLLLIYALMSRKFKLVSSHKSFCKPKYDLNVNTLRISTKAQTYWFVKR